ncbi:MULTISPECIES: hypothetical protein [Bradyrhizobium]|uniref:hypothetical protein n=1 Tax=Bradyrhizobium TaxID=374 RepID=UPI001EDAB42C|nr:hypothetical protein [Bradyrhizobium zhengyangense]MCG2643807.1 hypothetical protein [Bradyrhizobium zhengyangense]
MSILNWDRDQPEILDRLSPLSKLKICCKTLSEPEMVRGWVKHHSAILGSRNLIIADNGSLDDATLQFYGSLENDVTIFQFQGSHNDIHWHPRFRPLFDRLKQSVDFFSFIDVDERLIWIEEDKWAADEIIVDQLQNTSAIYPTTWLINAIGHENRFTQLDTERRPILSNNLKWGKPIFPSRLVGAQAGIHNVQYKGQEFSQDLAGKLFLLHLTQFPNQRIAANVKKLANRGVVDRFADPEAILSMDLSAYPDKTVIRFQNEIADMMAFLNGDRSIQTREVDFLELAPDGTVLYSNSEARAAFSRFVNESAGAIRELFDFKDIVG